MATVEQYLSVLAGAQSATNADAQRAAAQMQIELKQGDPRRAIAVCMTLITPGQPIEARHFGYGVLQHVVAKRMDEFTPDERNQLAKVTFDNLAACGNAPANAPEPFMIKSKVATLMAEIVRRQGASLWTSLMPDLAAGANSESAHLTELCALVMRYVAEDVAVYNDDLIGGRMKELLFGLTSTLPQVLPALYRVLETHYARAVNAVAAGDTQGAKSHAAAVSAALSASAVYTEWAPLAPLFRSGLVDACGHFLASSEFRASACEVLRHLTHRRRGDTVNGAIKDAANANANANASGGGSGPEADAAADAAAVVAGLVGMCRSLGVAAQHVLQAPPAEGGSEELEYARRLTECMASLATNHLAVVPDPALRAAFLEALLGLTKYPSLAVLGAAIPAWPGLLRGMGAELPGAFQRPDGKGPGSGVYGAQQAQTQASAAAADVSSSSSAAAGAAKLPDGAVVALLETTRTWLEQGAGVAQGLSSAGVPTAMGDQWEQEYESRDELREAWVTLRARLMEVTKLCTALEPNAAASSAASRVSTTLAWLAPGAPLDANAASAEGRSAIDDAIGASLEGVVSFIEPVVQALPLTGAAAASTTPALESMLTSLLAIDLKSPVAVSQLARLLEALGRAALVRSEAASALLNRLFALLGSLPVEDAGAPPVRAKAAMLAGRTVQAARQRVCAAVLGVCAAAPNVFNAHLEAFANQVEGLRANGQLSGVERGSLAEALLAVAGPSGPARVRDVLRWLLEPVRARWVPAPGAASGDIAALASLAELAKGETGGSNGGSQGLSAAHWELFHDVQLAERCLRRSGGDHEPSASAEKKSTTAAANIPAGLVQPVDPPPPVEECPAADHLEWVLTMCNALCASVHRVWTPRGHEEARAVGLDRALAMSPEEQAAHLVHGPARTFALSGGGSPPPSATVTATRDWLRGLRDAAYAMMTLLSTHAPGAFYPSESVARAVSDAAYRDLQHMHDRHARFLLHALARPVLGRCPAAHRPLWHAALTSTLSPMMTERLARAWAKVKAATELSKEERERDLTHAAGAGGISGGGSGGGENTGGGSIVLEDLIHERVTRDLSRDYCALLELIAIPEGTFGRKTKGSGLTGHLAGVVGGGNDSPKGGGAKGSAMDASTAHGGGKHVRDWMRAVAAVDASGAPARGAISTATAALSWGDSEAVGRALHFLRGVTACAAAPDGDQSLRETAGAEILPACIGGLSVPSNSSHQAELLGLIRDAVVHLLPITHSVSAVLLGLPGMTSEGLSGVLTDLASIRSEKKAANRVKEMLLQAAGGPDALRAFAEAKAAATSVGAIQVPVVQAPRAAAAAAAAAAGVASQTWSEEDVNAIGLNPLTANVRATQ